MVLDYPCGPKVTTGSFYKGGRRVTLSRDVMTEAEVRDRETEVGRREEKDVEMLCYWL